MYFVCMYVCAPGELQEIVSPHMRAGNWTRVFWKSHPWALHLFFLGGDITICCPHWNSWAQVTHPHVLGLQAYSTSPSYQTPSDYHLHGPSGRMFTVPGIWWRCFPERSSQHPEKHLPSTWTQGRTWHLTTVYRWRAPGFSPWISPDTPPWDRKKWAH